MPALPRQLFRGLLDDAAVFPPRSAPIASAVAGHLIWRNTSNRDLLGPLLCPASGVQELCAVLPVQDHVRLAVVVDGGAEVLSRALEVVGDDPRLSVVAVEAAHRNLDGDAAEIGNTLACISGITSVLEVPRVEFDQSLALVAGGPWDIAKYRTGGMHADAFPTEGELATFLIACATNGVAFKLTAGLHLAVRNYDSRTGFQQHGVLNVLVATRVGQQGGSPVEVTSVLTERNSAVLVEFVQEWDAAGCADVRTALRSIGCCGVTDPIHELADLGLVERAAR